MCLFKYSDQSYHNKAFNPCYNPLIIHRFVNTAPEDDFPASYIGGDLHSGISCFDNKVGRDLIFVEAMVSSFKDWFHKIVGDVIFDKFISHFKTEQYNDEELKVLSEAYDKITDAFKYGKRKLKHFEEHLIWNCPKINRHLFFQNLSPSKPI